MCSPPWSGTNCTDCGDNKAWRYSGKGPAKGVPCQRIPHKQVNRGNGIKNATITYTYPKSVDSVMPVSFIRRLCQRDRYGIKTGCNKLCGVCMPTARTRVASIAIFRTRCIPLERSCSTSQRTPVLHFAAKCGHELRLTCVLLLCAARVFTARDD